MKNENEIVYKVVQVMVHGWAKGVAVTCSAVALFGGLVAVFEGGFSCFLCVWCGLFMLAPVWLPRLLVHYFGPAKLVAEGRLWCREKCEEGRKR